MLACLSLEVTAKGVEGSGVFLINLVVEGEYLEMQQGSAGQQLLAHLLLTRV